MSSIEDFLRENKPQVKEDPTFILETQRRTEAVEGLKAEVDRQRGHGRMALIVALVAGLAVGVLLTAVAYLYPIDAESVGEGVVLSARLFLQTWRQYLIYPVALLALVLSLVLSKRRKAAL